MEIDGAPKTIEPFKESEEILSRSEIKDKNFVKEFKNFNLYIPRTYEDSCILGKGTEWCTATEKTSKWYKKYHKPGRELLIFISKTDSKEKYQLHLRSKQFMDKFDNEVNLKTFLNKNEDIKDWLLNNYNKEYGKYFNENSITWGKNTLIDSPKIVEGDFYCDNNKLTSLEGAPEKVEGYFNCSYNQLTSLEGAPKIVEGDFNCSNNQLTSLDGAPKIVEGDFNCSSNQLTSLDGAPEIVEGNFSCSYNKLISLEGAPKIVEGGFYCSSNQLTSLEGAPKKVEGYFYCYDNQLTSLKGAPEIVEGDFNCYNNQLTEKDIEWLKQNCKIKGIIIWE